MSLNWKSVQERKVAVDSLNAAAQQLQAALPLLSKHLAISSPVAEHYSLDNFKQTLNAAHDVSPEPCLLSQVILTQLDHWSIAFSCTRPAATDCTVSM